MSRKGKPVTTGQNSEMNGATYTTVMYWPNTGRVEGAVKHTTPFGHYLELPEDTPRPKKLSGRPKKAGAKKGAK
jgi:hypothetical protein